MLGRPDVTEHSHNEEKLVEYRNLLQIVVELFRHSVCYKISLVSTGGLRAPNQLGKITLSSRFICCLVNVRSIREALKGMIVRWSLFFTLLALLHLFAGKQSDGFLNWIQAIFLIQRSPIALARVSRSSWVRKAFNGRLPTYVLKWSKVVGLSSLTADFLRLAAAVPLEILFPFIPKSYGSEI